jgi:hypothetical protein
MCGRAGVVAGANVLGSISRFSGLMRTSHCPLCWGSGATAGLFPALYASHCPCGGSGTRIVLQASLSFAGAVPSRCASWPIGVGRTFL